MQYNSKNNDPGLFGFIAKYSKGAWKWLFLAIVSTILVVLFNLIKTYFIEVEINRVSSGEYSTMFFSLILLLSTFILGVFASYFEVYAIKKFAIYTSNKLRISFNNKIINAKISEVEKGHSGNAMSIMTNEIVSFSTFLQNNLSELFSKPLIFFAGFFYMLHINITLALISIISIPILLFMTRVVAKKVSKYAEGYYSDTAKANTVLQDYLGGLGTVTVYGLKKLLLSRFDEASTHALEWNKRMHLRNSMVLPFVILTYELPIFVCVIVGGCYAISGKIQPGSLVAFITLLRYVVEPLATLPNIISEYMKNKGAVRRIESFSSLESELLIKDDNFIENENDYVIEFKDVSFSYDGINNVLQGINLKIPRGSSVAFVGPSGSGKSTITGLLSGFYRDYEGDIFVLGNDIKNVDLDTLRSNISMVSQNDYIFSCSVYDNIKFGNLSASYEDVKKAAFCANSDKFITNLPQAYDTMLGNGGVQLSGGEVQRIALSRAIVSKSKILVLDEFTSALDSESESLILNAVKSLEGYLAKIIVAHRLDSITDVDIIFVFNNARVVEIGTHKSLLEKKGLYYNLYQTQTSFNEQGK